MDCIPGAFYMPSMWVLLSHRGVFLLPYRSGSYTGISEAEGLSLQANPVRLSYSRYNRTPGKAFRVARKGIQSGKSFPWLFRIFILRSTKTNSQEMSSYSLPRQDWESLSAGVVSPDFTLPVPSPLLPLSEQAVRGTAHAFPSGLPLPKDHTLLPLSSWFWDKPGLLPVSTCLLETLRSFASMTHVVCQKSPRSLQSDTRKSWQERNSSCWEFWSLLFPSVSSIFILATLVQAPRIRCG